MATIPAFYQEELLKSHIIQYFLHPDKSRLFSGKIHCDHHVQPIFIETNWSEEYKYLDSTNKNVSKEIMELPKDYGGVYLFYIRGMGIPFMERFILYVGRAQLTANGFNINERASDYIEEYKSYLQNKNCRTMIGLMFKIWKKYLYFRYFPSRDNKQILEIEEYLIKTMSPFCNREVPNNQTPKPNVTAFNNR